MPIAASPKFAGSGRTLSLLNEEVLLLGGDDLGNRGQYVSIQKPRDGLLALKYTIEHLPIRQLPHQHSSLVSRNTLTVVGGKFKSRGKFSKFTWTELSLKWENGSAFSPNFIDACSVKLGVDLHILFGGETKDQQTIGRQVVKINTTEEIAYELNPMKHSRVSHDCQLLDSSVVLVSGGLAQRGADPSEVLSDELYDITESGEVIEVLNLKRSLGRVQHVLMRTGEKILAFGGRNSRNIAPSKIEEFDPKTNSWRDLNQELHSSNTSELVVTPFPIASLDCVPQCQCGVGSRAERIFGGSEAEVKNILTSIFFLFRPILFPGLPLFCGMRTSEPTLSIASAALC